MPRIQSLLTAGAMIRLVPSARPAIIRRGTSGSCWAGSGRSRGGSTISAPAGPWLAPDREPYVRAGRRTNQERRSLGVYGRDCQRDRGEGRGLARNRSAASVPVPAPTEGDRHRTGGPLRSQSPQSGRPQLRWCTRSLGLGWLGAVQKEGRQLQHHGGADLRRHVGVVLQERRRRCSPLPQPHVAEAEPRALLRR